MALSSTLCFCWKSVMSPGWAAKTGWSPERTVPPLETHIFGSPFIKLCIKLSSRSGNAPHVGRHREGLHKFHIEASLLNFYQSLLVHANILVFCITVHWGQAKATQHHPLPPAVPSVHSNSCCVNKSSRIHIQALRFWPGLLQPIALWHKDVGHNQELWKHVLND